VYYRTTHEAELRAAFMAFQPITRVDMKHGFAFAEFVSPEVAKAATSMDGKELGGRRMVVEVAKGTKSTLKQRREIGRDSFSIRIDNLDPKTSWQDLKDFFRAAAAGPISFCDVWMEKGRKLGVVQYLSANDMNEAMRKLDGQLLGGYRVRMRTDSSRLIQRSRSESRSSSSSSSSSRRSSRRRMNSRSNRDSRSGSRSRSRSRDKKSSRRRSRDSRSRSRSPGTKSRHSRHSRRRRTGDDRYSLLLYSSNPMYCH
jgi:splicing factor, arginine/serine-rich 4/5/6